MVVASSSRGAGRRSPSPAAAGIADRRRATANAGAQVVERRATPLSLVRRRPHFRRVWLSEVVSLLGDWMSFVAVSLLALREGGGVIALGLVLVGHNLPSALFAPVAGVLADRLDRKRLLVFTNVAQGVLTLAMAGAASVGAIAWVQLLVFARASVGALLLPVQSAVLRHVVEEDELLEANAVSSATWSVMFAVGMAAGGAIAALGPTLALLADASSFAIAALLLRGLALSPTSDRAAPSGAAAPAEAFAPFGEDRPAEAGFRAALLSVHRDMIAAWKHASGRAALLDAVFAKTPVALANGGALILLNLRATEVPFAGTAAFTLGLLQCLRGAGTGIGPLVSAALVRRGMRIQRAAAISVGLTFAAIALFALTRSAAALLAAALAWGIGSGSNWVLSSSEIQRLSADRFVGRLSALDALSFTLALCATSLGGAALVDATGRSEIAAWSGLAAAALVWLAARWGIARIARDAPGIRR